MNTQNPFNLQHFLAPPKRTIVQMPSIKSNHLASAKTLNKMPQKYSGICIYQLFLVPLRQIIEQPFYECNGLPK